MTGETDDAIPISALQHAVYCLRQAALIHIERVWEENRFTAEGRVLHEVVHEKGQRPHAGARIETCVEGFEIGGGGSPLTQGRGSKRRLPDRRFPLRGRPQGRGRGSIQVHPGGEAKSGTLLARRRPRQLRARR